MSGTHVRSPCILLTEEDVRPLVAPALIKLCADHGPSKVGLMIGCHAKTVGRARDKHATLEASTLLNLLAADANALDLALAHFGYRLTKLHSVAANDLHTAVGLLDAGSEIVRAYEDGERQREETIRIADKLRPHLPAAIAIVREADEIRGAA